MWELRRSGTPAQVTSWEVVEGPQESFHPIQLGVNVDPFETGVPMLSPYRQEERSHRQGNIDVAHCEGNLHMCRRRGNSSKESAAICHVTRKVPA